MVCVKRNIHINYENHHFTVKRTCFSRIFFLKYVFSNIFFAKVATVLPRVFNQTIPTYWFFKSSFSVSRFASSSKTTIDYSDRSSTRACRSRRTGFFPDQTFWCVGVGCPPPKGTAVGAGTVGGSFCERVRRGGPLRT